MMLNPGKWASLHLIFFDMIAVRDGKWGGVVNGKWNGLVLSLLNFFLVSPVA
jgi:hypothetical protein